MSIVDYRQLLKRYISHVSNCEGCDFIDRDDLSGFNPLTAWEHRILGLLRTEYNKELLESEEHAHPPSMECTKANPLIFGTSKVGNEPVKPELVRDCPGLDWLALVRAFPFSIGQRITPRADVKVYVSQSNNVSRFVGDIESMHTEAPVDGVSRVTIILYHEL